MGDAPWSVSQAALMRRAYGSRFTFVRGLSNETVPEYARQHPDLACDVIFVDGAKHREPRLVDLANFRKLAAANAILFYDEATSLECVTGQAKEKDCPGHFGASQAYNRAARLGWVHVRECAWDPGASRRPPSFRDGSCVAEYAKG